MKINKVRYIGFFLFFCLAVRFIVVYLSCLTGTYQFIGWIALLLAFSVCWWQTVKCAFLFVALIPLISGVQVSGFMAQAPLCSFAFSILYTAWLPKYLFDKKKLISENFVSRLIDTLAGIVLLSIFACFFSFPLKYSLYRLATAPIMGQLDSFWFMDAGFIALQGLFLYRIFELELKQDPLLLRFVKPVLYSHAFIICCFGFWEIAERVINKKSLFFISKPFLDIHSYAGYVLFLFLYFSYLFLKRRKYVVVNLTFALFFLCFLFLAGSFSALLSCGILIIGFAFYKRFWIIPAIKHAMAFWKESGRFATKFHLTTLKSRKAAVLIGIFCLVVTGIIGISSIKRIEIFFPQKYITRLNLHNTTELGTVKAREELWGRAVRIVKKFPLTGLGIGSYFKESGQYAENEVKRKFMNAHNYYLQFAAELGLPAVLLWGLIVLLILRIGWGYSGNSDGKGLIIGISGFMISMMSGHHLILSTHQFLFWFVLFAIMAFSVDGFSKGGLKSENMPLSTFLTLVLIIVLAAHVYQFAFSQKQIKGLYRFGFYNEQLIKKDQMYWLDKFSQQKVRAETEYLGFSIFADPQNVSSGSIEVDIFIDGFLIDRILFDQKGMKHKYYHIPGIKNREITITTRSNNTYNPYKMGLSNNMLENREQSAAITDIVFFRIPIHEGVKQCFLTGISG